MPQDRIAVERDRGVPGAPRAQQQRGAEAVGSADTVTIMMLLDGTAG